MNDYKLWKLRCPKCGFSFVVGTNADLPEESVRELKECPCGAEMQECESLPPYNEQKDEIRDEIVRIFGGRMPMADFVRGIDVTTRKPHRCFGCNREFPAGTKMEYRVWLDDHWVHEHFCRTCLEVEKELSRMGESEYYRGDLREDALEYERRGRDNV